jgi:hypothetical protein
MDGSQPVHPWQGSTAAQREELKQKLGFKTQEHGLKLGWFLNKEFKRFKERGLVSETKGGPKDGPAAVYHKDTQLWLSKEWSGILPDQKASQDTAELSRRRTIFATTSSPKSSNLKYILKCHSPNAHTLENMPKRRMILVDDTYSNGNAATV